LGQLEKMLDRLQNEPERRMSVRELKEFHYLYERASADLVKITTFWLSPEVRGYVETLVSRAYGEIHETREKPHRFRPVNWLFNTFPQTFRRHVNAFWLSLAITLAGAAFGGAAIALDPGAKTVIMPFPGLQGNPAERVAKEERALTDRLQGKKARFSSMLMTHNTQIAILALALG